MQLLNLQGVSKYFSERCLFMDVSFSVESGRHIGVVGANGTGKTTLFKMITGREEYDSGRIVISKAARLGTGRLHGLRLCRTGLLSPYKSRKGTR